MTRLDHWALCEVIPQIFNVDRNARGEKMLT